jgi:diacylglycerol kinase (ATP)
MKALQNLLFIINKHSGKGYEPGLEGKIIDICQQRKAVATIQFTQRRGHATELAQQGIGQYDAIIAVGGDGTVNETARALIHGNTPLGIIPKGSGNGLARHLKISQSISGATVGLFTSTVIRIDTLQVNHHTGINVAGIGFDGHIANLFGTNQVRGFYGYLRLVLAEYLRYREFTYTLSGTNQQINTTGFIIAIANASQYGNNAFIAPRASVQDGLLDIIMTNKIPVVRSVSLIMRLFNRSLKPGKLYAEYKTAMCQITCEMPVSFHIDGEPCGADKNFLIQVRPASLPILLPSANGI